ncbi:unnamed protein product [Cyprideis torosa]|uniref:Uncharacterized protein n=1 Tax=Cyprideis torosa TaxID=163714 RepID=A0A7R8W9P9_9CRUS|nr:unnamed protein product [Cyprideis torosa]CAG0890034.1 unnamed protein product [Cyprideis torosa]
MGSTARSSMAELAYQRFLEENPQAGRFGEDDDEEVEYDADGNPVVTHKRYIDPLPPIDHSQIDYPPFEKNFYTETEDIASLTNQQVQELRGKLGIKVYGAAPPKPVTSFAHFGLDEGLMKTIRRSEYTQPTPIQAQGIPIALRGRDIIGIAKTGSGKTAAFIIPMITHIMDQPQLQRGDGPIGLILAPTRELSLQAREKSKDISPEAENLDQSRPNVLQGKRAGGGLVYGAAPPKPVTSFAHFGLDEGLMKTIRRSEYTQPTPIQAQGIPIALRGRDIIGIAKTGSGKTAAFIIPMITHIMDQPQLQRGDGPIGLILAPTRELSLQAREKSKDISPEAENLDQSRPNVLQGKRAGGGLINAEELANNLKLRDVEPLLLHGDMNQVDRNEVISKFRKKESNVLVATDVAARGLDIPHIRTVINYDVARDIDTHTHRIGRTGRAGEKGTAVTLITSKDKDFAGHLVRNLEAAGQEVSKELMSLAMQNQWFRKSRFRNSEGRKPNVGGHGLGYKETGGGSSTAASSSFQSASSVETGKMDPSIALRDAFKAQYMANSNHPQGQQQQPVRLKTEREVGSDLVGTPESFTATTNVVFKMLC